jgi:cytochrome c oxidase subunit II
MTDIGSAANSEEVSARYESRWTIFMLAIIVLLLAMIVFTGLHWASMPPSRVEVIDATTLHLRGEFIEDNLGTMIESNGDVTVRVLAEQYAFRPHCVVVPEGEPVTFRATSSDVVHGFQIIGTNVNTMLVPGYISTFVTTLKGVGERSMPCHEFCGVGHAAMWAQVQVLPKALFHKLTQSNPRLSCV